mmetsp:Transcript_49499/g.87143  ORF Transcript_49499/g.87143 Transcript_49499/m.87143 type:complete len:124 (-) Transcript_49499:990-1361(-)
MSHSAGKAHGAAIMEAADLLAACAQALFSCSGSVDCEGRAAWRTQMVELATALSKDLQVCAAAPQARFAAPCAAMLELSAGVSASLQICCSSCSADGSRSAEDTGPLCLERVVCVSATLPMLS